MHTVFALLCFVVVIHWLIFPYPSGLLHWHCGNLTIAPVPAKQPWWIWINTLCEFIMNDCITTTKQSTTKPCAYFLGCTVYTKTSHNDTNVYVYMGYYLPNTQTVGSTLHSRLLQTPFNNIFKNKLPTLCYTPLLAWGDVMVKEGTSPILNDWRLGHWIPYNTPWLQLLSIYANKSSHLIKRSLVKRSNWGQGA